VRDGVEVGDQQFAPGVAGDLAQSGIDLQPAPVRPDHGHADGGILHGGAKLVLTQPQRFFDVNTLGDELREKNQAANGSVRLTPGAGLPLHPFHRAVRARDGIALALFDRAFQDVVINFLPAIGQAGKHLVAGQPDNIPAGQAVVNQPAVAGLEAAHLRVKHRHGGRRVLDELVKQGFVGRQSLAGAP
jgi:hypothetical protein